MPRRAQVFISDKAKQIQEKLTLNPEGETLTRGERKQEVTREEAAALLSARAGRTITADYIRQLTRGDKPRLTPHRATGNTYTYLVEDLVAVKFSRGHRQKEEAGEDAA